MRARPALGVLDEPYEVGLVPALPAVLLPRPPGLVLAPLAVVPLQEKLGEVHLVPERAAAHAHAVPAAVSVPLRKQGVADVGAVVLGIVVGVVQVEEVHRRGQQEDGEDGE